MGREHGILLSLDPNSLKGGGKFLHSVCQGKKPLGADLVITEQCRYTETCGQNLAVQPFLFTLLCCCLELDIEFPTLLVDHFGLINCNKKIIAKSSQGLLITCRYPFEDGADPHITTQQPHFKGFQGGNSQAEAQDRVLYPCLSFLYHPGKLNLLIMAEQIKLSHLSQIDIHRIDMTLITVINRFSAIFFLLCPCHTRPVDDVKL